MEKDRLLDYMFDQNRRLSDQVAGMCEEMRLQRGQAEMHHRELKLSLDRMEELAVAAEKRAVAVEKRAERSEIEPGRSLLHVPGPRRRSRSCCRPSSQ